MTGHGAALEALVRAIVVEVVREEVRNAAASQRPAEGFQTTAQAAVVLGVTRDTILDKIHRGDLPAVKPPGSKSWRIRSADVEAALSGALPPPTPVDLVARRAAIAARAEAAVKKGAK